MGDNAGGVGRAIRTGLLGAALITGAGAAHGRDVVGTEARHRVQPGDTLRSLAARYAVDARTLARLNGLPRGAALPVGDELRVVSEHVVPRRIDDGIVINVPQRMLFLFSDGRLAGHFPVGIGRRGWTTPAGRYRIVEKEEDPSWEVPRSIQAEMRRKGQRVVKRMAPGPDNPLGRHWLGLDRNGIGIHGTPQTSTLFGFVSHGCVRMHPDDIEGLFGEVDVGTPVEIVYQPMLLGRDEDGRVVLEVHPDVYRRVRDPMAVIRRQAEEMDVAGLLDWTAVRSALRERAGIAVPVEQGTADLADE